MKFVKFVGRVLGTAVISIVATQAFKTFVQPKIVEYVAGKAIAAAGDKDTMERAVS